MHLITKQEILSLVPQRYKAQYPKNRQMIDGSWSDDVLRKLLALESLTEEAVKELLNDGWTRHVCDICRSDCDSLVSMETRAHEEYGNSLICKACLQKALSLLD